MTKAQIDLPSADKLLHSVGLDERGAVQVFHTQNVLRRMLKYIPKRSSAMRKRTIIGATPTDIETAGPEVQYQYHGKVMEDPKINAAGFFSEKMDSWFSPKGGTKVLTDRDLTYTTPGTGPYWDRAVTAAEGDAMVAELQKYVDYLGRSK